MRSMFLFALPLTLLAMPAAAQQVIVPGTITIEPLPDAAGPPETRTMFAEAVGQALLDAGFLALPHGQGRYVARLTLVRTPRGSVTVHDAKGGLNPVLGSWGGGVVVDLPSNKTQIRGLYITELEVEIVARVGGQPVWHGSALTVKAQGSADDSPAVLGPRLARAALQTFPSTMPQPVSVP